MRAAARAALLCALMFAGYLATSAACASSTTPTTTALIHTAPALSKTLVLFAKDLKRSFSNVVSAWFVGDKLALVVQDKGVKLVNLKSGETRTIELPSRVQAAVSGGEPATAICLALSDGTLGLVKVTAMGSLSVERVDVLKQGLAGSHVIDCDQVRMVVGAIDRVVLPEGFEVGVLYLYKAPSLGRAELGATRPAEEAYELLKKLLGSDAISVEGLSFELEPLRLGGYVKSASRIAIKIASLDSIKSGSFEAVALLAYDHVRGLLRVLMAYPLSGKLVDFSLASLKGLHVLPLLIDVNGTMVLRVLYLSEGIEGAKVVYSFEDIVGSSSGSAALQVYPLENSVVIGVDLGGKLLLYLAEPEGVTYASGLAYMARRLGALEPFKLFSFDDSPYVIYVYSSSLNVYDIKLGRPLWLDYEGVPLPPSVRAGIVVEPHAAHALVFLEETTLLVDLRPTLKGVSKLALKVYVRAEGTFIPSSATVTLECLKGSWSGIERKLLAPAEGLEIILPAGTYSIMACREPYGCAEATMDLAPGSSLKAELEMRAAAFKFCVYSPGDPQGLGFGRGAVEGAEIKVEVAGSVVAKGVTNREGCWQVLLGVGREYVVYVSAPGFVPSEIRGVKTPSTYTIELAPRLAKLSVKAVDASTGSELEAKVVVASRGTKVVLKAPFEVSLPPGNYSLSVTAPNYRSQSKLVVLRPGERKYVVISLMPTEYDVRLLVKDPQGAPVSGARLLIEGTSFNGLRVVKEVVSGTDGSARVPLLAGTYVVKVKAHDFEPMEVAIKVPTRGPITLILKLTPLAAFRRQVLGFIHGYGVYLAAAAVTCLGAVAAHYVAKKVRARRPRREVPLEELLGI